MILILNVPSIVVCTYVYAKIEVYSYKEEEILFLLE